MNHSHKKIMNTNALSGQHGFSLLQWLVILAVAGFFILFAFKIVPIYSENMYVTSALKSLPDSGSRLQDMTNTEIISKLRNFYTINNVRSEGPTKNIKINRNSDKVVVMIDYETRTNLFYNIDLVLTFENHLDSTRIDKCCKPLSGNE